jgi:nitrogen regulatory protein P-II 1
MQLITALAHIDSVEALALALDATPASGFTLTEVRRFEETDSKQVFRGSWVWAGSGRALIEVAVADDQATDVIEALLGAAKRVADYSFRAWVTPMIETYRIRTGDWEG